MDVQRAFDEGEAAGQRRNHPDAVKRHSETLALRYFLSGTKALNPGRRFCSSSRFFSKG